MTTRTTSKIVTFARPFTLKGVDLVLPAGNYRVVTDEELIEQLSFPVYRRVSTMIFVPAKSASSVEIVAIDPQDLQVAQERDLKFVIRELQRQLRRVAAVHESANGRMSRVPPVHTAIRNCTRDGGGPFEIGNQVLISSHRKLLSSKTRW
ncbi:MAG: hypothetical protein ACLPQ0_11075 [Candidatus Binatus sp.]